MKTMTKFSALVLLVSLVACNSQKHKPVVYKVNSAKADCVGVAPMRCLMVQKGDSIDTDYWEFFYSAIEGFNYEAGNIYTISVKETPLPKDEIPADGSSVNYELVEVIEKKQDPLFLLHDIYVVTEISGTKVLSEDSLTKAPTMEIYVSERRVSGTDGCNNYSAAINELSESKISFSPIASTKMMCPDMTYPDKFGNILSNVKAYHRENGFVELKNSNDEVVIVLKKID